ncbi:MAG: T9SS type A sorting domain-containing protein [Bacteroidetes bacterium]|nr:MAG: T9SS type A sorting domain-containing protein [Bacteroidota bacterium]
MKRFVLCFFLFAFCCASHGMPRTWIGGGTGNWSVGANWSPNGVPTTSDDLTISNSATITIDAPPLLSSLLITGNATVKFTVTNSTITPLTRIFTPTSTTSTTKGFQLDLGSTLTFETNISNTGSVNMTLRFGAGVFGLINGTLIFNGSLAGTGNPLTTIDLNTTSNVQVNGTIQFDYASDNITGATTANLFFNSGSVMEILKNGGSFPAATWNSNSLAKVENIFGTNGPVFLGTAYGNLEWDCASQTFVASLTTNVSFNNVSFISTNGAAFSVTTGASVDNHTMTINGNLTIQSSAYVNLVGNSSPAGSSGKISLKGNLDLQTGGTLITNGAAGTTSQLELSGSSNQNITANGIFSGVRMEVIMNGVSATLLTQVILPGDFNATNANLQLVNGKIKATGSSKLIMLATSSVSGGSTNSFVEGPMQKRGNTDFVFPLGIGGIYAPLGMYNGSGAAPTDAFTAEYKRANPQSIYGPNVQATMNHVSYVEYWTLSRNLGTASKLISLDVHPLSFCKALASTYVSQWNGSLWTKLNTGITDGPHPVGLYQTGTIQTLSAVSNFASPDTAFTLITDLNETANPLPVTLITFDAHKLSATKSSVDWELASVCSPAAKFEVQRTETATGFVTIGAIPGTTTGKSYNFIDNDLKNGINYYRLKITGEDGQISYSRTIAIMNGVNTVLLTSMIPTVVNHSASLTVSSSAREKITIVVTDMQGRVVQQNSYNIDNGNSTIEIRFDRLVAGIYQLTGTTSSGRLNTIRFMKQ